MPIETNGNAAHSLEGRTLNNRWLVKEKIERDVNQSGSNFSVGYIVKKDNKDYFLKAFDLAGFHSQSRPGSDIMDVLNEMTRAFIYERDLSKHCEEKHVTKVSFVVGHGTEMIEGFTLGTVPYLIFELAKGDIRKTIDFSDTLSYIWRFKSLHDIAIGLKQLHTINVSHQDIKPSNILVFDSSSKICDLGRSVCNDIDGPFNNLAFSGDGNYSPPEIWYRYFEQDWKKRTFAIDCYMLGSLIVFYFSGISMSALLTKHIPVDFRAERWRGEYKEIIPYLENAFSKALDEFSLNIKDDEIKKELSQLVRYLCNPFPEKRGHPKNIISSGDSYGMERFISKLNILKHKVETNFKRGDI